MGTAGKAPAPWGLGLRWPFKDGGDVCFRLFFCCHCQKGTRVVRLSARGRRRRLSTHPAPRPSCPQASPFVAPLGPSRPSPTSPERLHAGTQLPGHRVPRHPRKEARGLRSPARQALTVGAAPCHLQTRLLGGDAGTGFLSRPPRSGLRAPVEVCALAGRVTVSPSPGHSPAVERSPRGSQRAPVLCAAAPSTGSPSETGRNRGFSRNLRPHGVSLQHPSSSAHVPGVRPRCPRARGRARSPLSPPGGALPRSPTRARRCSASQGTPPLSPFSPLSTQPPE